MEQLTRKDFVRANVTLGDMIEIKEFNGGSYIKNWSGRDRAFMNDESGKVYTAEAQDFIDSIPDPKAKVKTENTEVAATTEVPKVKEKSTMLDAPANFYENLNRLNAVTAAMSLCDSAGVLTYDPRNEADIIYITETFSEVTLKQIADECTKRNKANDETLKLEIKN